MPSPEGDIPLPIVDVRGGEPEAPAENHWPLPRQQPTTLIALWPGDHAPTRPEVIAALDQHASEPAALLQELPESDGVHWNGVYRLSILESPVIVWAEPARPLSPGELDDPAALACKWVVGFEAMLDPQEPHRDFAALLRLVAAATESPAALDVVTMRWFTALTLKDLTQTPPATPPVEALWTVHAVARDMRSSESLWWLHTHGLWRCGLPELEMLEVPAAHQRDAARLLNEIAGYALDSPLAAAGEPMEIGSDLHVTLHPWKSLMKQLAQDSLGGEADRKGEDDPHGGVRAVICGPEPRGTFRKQWMWPQEAVAKLAGDEAVVYRSRQATQRAAAAAQAAWDELATAFASAPKAAAADSASSSNGEPSFAALVKAGFPADDGDPDHHEHLWFEIKRFDGGFAEAELVNQPLFIGSMSKGTMARIGREQVSDWIVFTAAGRFGPDSVPALWRAIDALRRPKGGA